MAQCFIGGQSGSTGNVRSVDISNWTSKDLSNCFERIKKGSSSNSDFYYDSSNNRIVAKFSSNGGSANFLAVIPFDKTIAIKWACNSIMNVNHMGNDMGYGFMVAKPTEEIGTSQSGFYGFIGDYNIAVPVVVKNYLLSNNNIWIVYENHFAYFLKETGETLTALYIPDDVKYLVFSDKGGDTSGWTQSTYITEVREK